MNALIISGIHISSSHRLWFTASAFLLTCPYLSMQCAYPHYVLILVSFYSAAITVGFGNTTVVVQENATYVILHVHILTGHLLRNASVDFHTMDGTALGMHVQLHNNNIINICWITVLFTIEITIFLTVKFECKIKQRWVHTY